MSKVDILNICDRIILKFKPYTAKEQTPGRGARRKRKKKKKVHGVSKKNVQVKVI